MKKISKFVLLLVAVALTAICFVGCTAKTYTVTFKNGETTVTTATINEGTTIYPANMAVNEGVVFEGWFSDEELTEEFDFDSLIANDLTLYAKFTSNLYTVTYNLGGATGTVPTQASVNANGSFTVTKTVPIWEGYEFKGWSDGTDVYNADDEYTVKGTDNVVLTAKWEYKTVHVSFYDGDGVKMESFEKDLPYGSDVVAPTSDEVPVPNFCFVQKGWTNAEGEDISLENITSDTNFYATYDYVPSDLNLFKFKLNFDGNSYSVAAKNSNISGKIALPKTYNGMDVTTVSKEGFMNCRYIEKIYIPNTFTIIKAGAFNGTKLSEVYIEDGLKTIEARAFQNFKYLTMFQIPKSVDDIHWWAFAYTTVNTDFEFITDDNGFYKYDKDNKILYGDNEKQILFVHYSVTELNVKASVEEIYPCACYSNSNLTTVNIAGNVKDIGPAAFEDCINLTSFNISGSVENLWGNEKSTEDGVYVNNEGIFYGSSISNLTFPNGLKHIGSSTFFMCFFLTEISIPNSVEYISEQAFQNAIWLQNDVNFGMGQSAGGLANITMTAGVNDKYYIDQNKAVIEKGTGIKGGDTFIYYCMNAAGTEYSIPSEVTSLTPFAFAYNANLITLTIPEGVEEIPCSFAQAALNLATINIPASVINITNDALTEFMWGGISMSGGYGAFLESLKLVNINIAENSRLEYISTNSFNNIGCVSLTIPASVELIDPFAIFGYDLESIIVEEGNTVYYDIDGILFSYDKTLVQYPAGKTDTEYTIPLGIEKIGRAAFSACVNLNKVTMGADVKEIGYDAFRACYKAEYDLNTGELLSSNGLEEVVMNEGLEIIKDGAFNYCMLLSKISFYGLPPQLISGTADNGCSHNIFGYYDGNTETYEFLPLLKFEVPSEYLLEYYIEWYEFAPHNTYGLNIDEITSIAYNFETNGGSTVEGITGFVLTDIPLSQKEGYYFWGWYTSNSIEGVWDDKDMVVFPYIYKKGLEVTLYARWETVMLENGLIDIWAYQLKADEPISIELYFGACVWFSYTPAINCTVMLGGTEALDYYTFLCFDELGTDLTEWYNYLTEMNSFGFVLEAGHTYYFVIGSAAYFFDGGEYNVTEMYTRLDVYVIHYDMSGNEVELELSNVAILTPKFYLE